MWVCTLGLHVKFGIHLPQYGRAASASAIRDAAVAAEELGFADVWASDHIVRPAAQDYPSAYLFDPLLTLTWAAAATTTVGLGTSVLVAPQYHPLWLANATSSLDALSGGRRGHHHRQQAKHCRGGKVIHGPAKRARHEDSLVGVVVSHHSTRLTGNLRM